MGGEGGGGGRPRGEEMGGQGERRWAAKGGGDGRRGLRRWAVVVEAVGGKGSRGERQRRLKKMQRRITVRDRQSLNAKLYFNL